MGLPGMSSYTSSSERRFALIVAAVVIGAGQLGRVPVPRVYRIHEDAMFGEVRERSRTDARTADVIVMGDSRVLFGIKPPEVTANLDLPGMAGRKPRVVNLAGPAAILSSDVWLWREITNGPKPPRARLVVIGLAPIDVTPKSPGYDNNLRYLYGIRDVLWLLRSGRIHDAATLLTYRLFPLYAVRHSVINMVLKNRQREPPLAPPSPTANLWWLMAHQNWYSDYTVDPWQVQCLEQMVADMQRRGVRVVFFTPPVALSLLRLEAGLRPGEAASSQALISGKAGSPLRMLHQAVAPLTNRPDAIYLNYARPEYAKRFKFWDPTHLLPGPAAAFSRELAVDINGRLRSEPPAADGQPAPARHGPPPRQPAATLPSAGS